MRARRSATAATDREVAVVAAVIAAGSQKTAAHRLGLSHSTIKQHLANARSKVSAETTAQLVWILAQRLPEPGLRHHFATAVDSLERGLCPTALTASMTSQ